MMILPDKKDAIHKAWLYRVLEAIADHPRLSHDLYFKGGTCASMLGWLDRFSVDLDFDYAGGTSADDLTATRTDLEDVFLRLGLSIKDNSKKGIQYFLKYPNSDTDVDLRTGRNTLKIDASFPLFSSSQYGPQRLTEIDRILICQTQETMFAHKLVAVLDRFEKTGAIAGRDLYDIHHFFLKGYSYDPEIIRERRQTEPNVFLRQLQDFIKVHVTDTIIREDLSALLPSAEFVRISKVLKREVLGFLATSS